MSIFTSDLYLNRVFYFCAVMSVWQQSQLTYCLRKYIYMYCANSDFGDAFRHCFFFVFSSYLISICLFVFVFSSLFIRILHLATYYLVCFSLFFAPLVHSMYLADSFLSIFSVVLGCCLVGSSFARADRVCGRMRW